MLFHKVNTGEPVTESGFITNMLHDSLQERHSHLIKLFSVNLSGPITAAMQSFANITMCYEVPWPVNLIFPDSILHTYNNVFIFLFQLKYSRWNLDQSWLIIRRCTDTTNVLVHKVLLLRAKLLQFVISVNHYILTRILHSSGLEFQDKVTSCDSMDTLLSMHRQYIATVHDRCLLNQKAQYVKEAVMKILLLVVRFYHKCLNMDEFSFNDGQFFEDEFSKCIRFLITYLKNHIKRGSYPHCELSVSFIFTRQMLRISLLHITLYSCILRFV
jgi:gamma-tubulin complex component 5